MSRFNLIDLTFREVQALTPDTVAVLPLGAVEQHGPHLPLSTDYTIATSVAEAAVTGVADAGRADVVLMPGLAYTKSDEHHWAPGTIWLSWDTLMRTLVDIGRSLAATPIERLLFVNGHGGNSALGQVACRQLRREFGLKTFLAHSMMPLDHGGMDVADPNELGFGIHGGFKETSLMLHLRPDLVRMDLAERAVPEALTEYSMIGFGKPVSFGWLSDDFGPAGHIGDPTGANAESGKSLFEGAVQAMMAAIDEASRFEVRP
ncbi:creatininase family protein [Phytoactinopolyspora halotolerans]|uniref:Creatininase family protein n=1 Tax=Phytoactinopolyspora halotolerans TaxID=1981512 RepID=A0A6L9SIF9_9ACTN|nr:creatininase family protein [Phytoactinopolyspora halotolerans]NEE04454.1 creatininase family protein [Phytoactinopolyspora halotolerans]